MSRNSPVRSVPVELLGGVLLGALQDEAVTLGKGERTAGKKIQNLCNLGREATHHTPTCQCQHSNKVGLHHLISTATRIE